MTNQKRRRGKALENDILVKTFELLQTTSYEDLTMDLIAKNAKTNKNVLYRRWNSKAEIVIASIQFQTPDFKLVAPHTNSLREDLLQFFNSIMDIFEKLNFPSLDFLIQERLGKINIRDFTQALNKDNYITIIINEILTSAAERKEIILSKISEEMRALPTILFLNLIFANRLTRERIRDLVDAILLPIYLNTVS